jgi:glycosyltransferase involved in cell wall biosynthesis
MYVHFDGTRGVSFERADDEGVRSIFVHAAPMKVRLNLIRRIWLMFRAYRRYYRGSPPEVIHAHCFNAAVHGYLIYRLYRIPLVITEHSSAMHSLSFASQIVARWAFARASAVVAVSEGLAHKVAQYTTRPVRVIPNMVRPEFFETPIVFKAPNEPFTFLSVGYCQPNKGWDLLLEAFSGLVHSGGVAQLILVGGGQCQGLRRLASDLGVSERVHFTGKMDRAGVMALMAMCDCHVMSSRVETFGIVNVEAMACGKPIIMTHTDAAELIVTESCGMVVPVEDAPGLQRAMTKMLTEARTYDLQQVRDDCRERFSDYVVCSRLNGLYGEVLDS